MRPPLLRGPRAAPSVPPLKVSAAPLIASAVPPALTAVPLALPLTVTPLARPPERISMTAPERIAPPLTAPPDRTSTIAGGDNLHAAEGDFGAGRPAAGGNDRVLPLQVNQRVRARAEACLRDCRRGSRPPARAPH